MRVILLLAAEASILAAVLLHSRQIEGRLLRSDPNAIPNNAALLPVAREHGEALYVTHCAACHGQQGQGDTERGIPNLTDDDWLYGMGSVSDIEQIVKYGIRSFNPKAWNLAIMPAYATARPSVRNSSIRALSPENIRDLAEFLVRDQGRAVDAAAAARGAELFAGVGGCYDCHAVDGKGDPAIGAPNLTDRITLYGDGSRESLSMSIAYGRHGVCPAWTARMTAAEIREAAIFVYTLSHEPRRTETDTHAGPD